MPPSAALPNVTVRHVTPADVPGVVNISIAAFGRDENLFPPTREPDAEKRVAAERRWREENIGRGLTAKNRRHVVAVCRLGGGADGDEPREKGDTERGGDEVMIGWAAWEVLQKEEASGEGEKSLEVEAKEKGWPEELDLEALRLLGGWEDDATEWVLKERRIEREGVWTLAVIAVLPEFQRQGVGRKLLDWGISEAGKAGKNIYLVSMPLAKKLYADAGFEELGKFKWFDTDSYQMLWTPHR